MSGQTPVLDGQGLLGALLDADVQLIIIGGLAVNAHGYIRATKDIDIVPEPTAENLHRLAATLDGLNARVLGAEEFAESELVMPDADGLAMGGNFILATDRGRLDILQLVSPDFGYRDLEPGSIEVEVFGRSVRICGYEDLVTMKDAADRDEDRLDLKRLREARSE